MIPGSDRTVRDVVLELPQATRVFEKLQIDYCCGGDKPLREACANAGVEVENLEQMLAEVEQDDARGNGSIDFRTVTLAELIRHILDKHHVYTKEEMARLEALIGKVIGAHGENHPELLRLGSRFQQLCDDLKPHMFKEEQILFPYILEMERSALENRPAPFAPFGTVNNPIRMMMMEHDTVGGLLRELRALSSNYTVPPDGCTSYQTLYQALEAFEADLHQHIHLENNVLFPRAIEMEKNGGGTGPETRSFSELLDLHHVFDDLFFEHQRALIHGDLDTALRILEAYEVEIMDHIWDEEELLIPIYASRTEAPVGGSPEIFLNEHRKIREYLALFKAEFAKLSTADDRERAVIFLLDSQTTFKRLLVHHDNRERKFLYPLLDQITSEQEKLSLFQRLRLPAKEEAIDR